MEITSVLRFLYKSIKKKKKKTKFHDFHEDIIINIFIRLPAEDLHRLRLVCKSWFNIIKSPQCIQAHLQNSKPGLINMRCDTVICRKDDKIHTSSLTAPTNVKTLSRWATCFSAACECKSRTDSPCIFAWASCNGLVLFSKSNKSIEELFVGNPVTRERSKLPSPTMWKSSSITWKYEYHHVLGMTYNASMNDYLILHYFTSFGSSFGCEILILGNNTWRVLNTSHLNVRLLSLVSTRVSFIKNIAYLVVVNCELLQYYTLLSLDVDKMKFHKSKEIPFYYDGHVFEVRGVPSLISFSNEYKHFGIWSLNDLERKDWISGQGIEIDGRDGVLSTLATLEDGNIIIFACSHRRPLNRTYQYHYFAYDILQKTTTYLDLKSEERMSFLSHIDSLVSCKL